METWLKDLAKLDRGQRMTRTDTGEPKGCLHSTETSGYPGYGGWTINPHMDIMPIPNRGIAGRQFIPLEYASFALRHTDNQQTNRDNVVQLELIGTCVKGGPGYYWPDADDAVLLDLHNKVIKPCSDILKIPLKALKFAPPDQATRLTNAQFDSYSGWLGHEHVPQNTHVDPGAFPWDRMIALANKPPVVVVVEEEDDMLTRVVKVTDVGYFVVWPGANDMLAKSIPGPFNDASDEIQCWANGKPILSMNADQFKILYTEVKNA